MLKSPVFVQLEITDVCNLRCKHCYHFDTDKMPESKDVEEEKIVWLVDQLVEAKIYSLIITGGEPLIRPDLVIKIIEVAKKAGMFVSVNTNLLLLNIEIVRKLEELKVDSLLVSCPASNPEIYKKITRCGDYAQFVSKLNILLATNISCLINMVVMQDNYLLVRETATQLMNLGIKRFAVTPVSLNVEYPNPMEMLNSAQTLVLLEDLAWCKDKLCLEVDILEPLPKCFFPQWCWEKDYAFTKRSCQAGRLSVSVSNIGDVRPCSHNPLIYGNLFREDLAEIWERMLLYRDEVIPVLCKKCPTVVTCNGGCRTNSLATTGSLSEKDPLAIGPVKLSKRKKEIQFYDDSVVCFKGKLRWREELYDQYSISSKGNHRNLTIVNQELFKFVCWLEQKLPMTIQELKLIGSNNSDQASFIRIISYLLRKEFLYLEEIDGT